MELRREVMRVPSQVTTVERAQRSLIRSLRGVVGAWRFELQTSCAQGSCKKSILLVRLALFYVMVDGFGPTLAVVGPKLDLSFSFQLGRRQAGADVKKSVVFGWERI